MNHRRMVLTASGLLALFTSFGVANNALAQSCETNSDCLKGFECQTYAGGTCSAPACVDNGDKTTCPEVKCETTEYRQCVSAPCAGDTDCADGMVCLKNSYQSCTGTKAIACAEGEECAPDQTVSDCKTVETSSCVPRYQAPCQIDSDCGDGFKCVESQQCWCSGSSGSAGSAESAPATPATAGGGTRSSGSSSGSGGTSGTAASAPEPAADEADGGAADSSSTSSCGCEPSGTFYCDMEEITCEGDADCPANWTCQENLNATSVCTASADGGVSCTESEPATKQCLPPYYNTYATRDSIEQAMGADTVGSAPKGVTATAGGSTTNGNNSATEGENAAADSDDGEESDAKSKSDGGCQVVLGHTSAATGWIIIAGLLNLFALRRRRAR